MELVQKPMHALALVPRVVNSIEGLFGRHSGAEKKESAISFVMAAIEKPPLGVEDEVVDKDRFKAGLARMIDGCVECLNASSWERNTR
jgi:hypothetical protein